MTVAFFWGVGGTLVFSYIHRPGPFFIQNFEFQYFWGVLEEKFGYALLSPAGKRGSSVVMALASGARGPRFDPR